MYAGHCNEAGISSSRPHLMGDAFLSGRRLAIAWDLTCHETAHPELFDKTAQEFSNEYGMFLPLNEHGRLLSVGDANFELLIPNYRQVVEVMSSVAILRTMTSSDRIG